MKDDSDNVVIMKASRHKQTTENKNGTNTGYIKCLTCLILGDEL